MNFFLENRRWRQQERDNSEKSGVGNKEELDERPNMDKYMRGNGIRDRYGTPRKMKNITQEPFSNTKTQISIDDQIYSNISACVCVFLVCIVKMLVLWIS